jgi:hypothetical protein
MVDGYVKAVRSIIVLTASLHHCITASLHHCITASLHQCIEEAEPRAHRNLAGIESNDPA